MAISSPPSPAFFTRILTVTPSALLRLSWDIKHQQLTSFINCIKMYKVLYRYVQYLHKRVQVESGLTRSHREKLDIDHRGEHYRELVSYDISEQRIGPHIDRFIEVLQENDLYG